MNRRPLVVLLGLCAAFLYPYWKSFGAIPIEESYLQFASYVEWARMNVVEHARPAAWAFHFGGGYPMFQHPENISLSPFFWLFVVPFGTGAGIKLFVFSSYAVGAVGFFLLARREFKLSEAAAGLLAASFVCNGWVPYQVQTGNLNNHGWFYLPLILYLLSRSVADRRWVAAVAATLALMAFNGFGIYFAPLGLFLVLFGLSQTRRRAWLENLVFAGIGALLLAAPKLLPAFELLEQNSRAIDDYAAASRGALTMTGLLKGWLVRGPFLEAGRDGLGMSALFYFGALPLAGFLAASRSAFPKVKLPLGIGLLFVWLAAAANAPVDLFAVVRELPVFGSMHAVAKYFTFPIVFLVPWVIAAGAASPAYKKLDERGKRLLAVLGCVAVLDMFVSNQRYFAALHDRPAVPEKIASDSDFYNVELSGRGDPGAEGSVGTDIWRGSQYFLLRQNLGSVNWWPNIDLEESAVPKFSVRPNNPGYWRDFRAQHHAAPGIDRVPGYSGEAFFREGHANKVRAIRWGADAVEIDIVQTTPDLLIVNQNYHPDWDADRGALKETGGRIGVSLLDPFEGTLRLRFRPRSSRAGWVLFWISLVGGGLLLRKRRPRWRFTERQTYAALAALSAAFLAPLLFAKGAIALDESFLQYVSYLEHNLRGLASAGALPRWAPHFGGGYPFFNHPENPALSPHLWLLVLPLGVGPGLRVFFLLCYIAGATGLYALAKRVFGFDRGPAVLAATLFVFTGFIPYQLLTGNLVEPLWFFLPWFLVLLHRSLDDWRWAASASVLFAFLVYSGLSLNLAPLALFVFAFSAVHERRRDLLPRAFCVLAGGALLAAAKLVPVFELLSQNSREYVDYASAASGAATFEALRDAWFARGPFIGMQDDGLGMSSVFYYGPIGAGLLLFAIVTSFRALRGWLALGAAFAFVGLAHNAPVDLFYALWHLPVFSSIHLPARYFLFPVMMLLPLAIAAGFQSNFYRKLERGRRIALAALALFMVAEMFAVNGRYLSVLGAKSIAEPVPGAAGEFFHVMKDDRDDSDWWGGAPTGDVYEGFQYFAIRQNVGVLNWFGNLNLGEFAIPRYFVSSGKGSRWRDFRGHDSLGAGIRENPAYRGEAWFTKKQGNSIAELRFGGDAVEVKVRSTAGGRLVVNQNYDAEWSVDHGRLTSDKGLLAVDLPAGFEGTLTLSYRPAAPPRGMWISILSLLLGIGWLLATWNRATHRPARR